MQKIAIDLDGVVFDSENLYRVYTEIYDVDVLKGNNLVDNTKRRFQERYNWPENTAKEFYKDNAMSILSKANIMTGAEVCLKKLAERFELVVVTARNDQEVELAKEKLNQVGIKDLIYFNNQTDKINCLMEEKIDYIIDDEESICKKASEKGIKAIYFKNAAAPLIPQNDNLKRVNNWGEIYKYLTLGE